MPNDCWNHITFTADTSDLNSFMENEFKDVPEWAIKIKVRGQGGVILNLWSRWLPNFTWLEQMVDQYPSAWLKNEWHEEGGTEGVWVGTKRGGTKEIKRIEWEGMCIEEEIHRMNDDVNQSH